MCEILKFDNPYTDSIAINKLNASYEISFALDRMYKNILLVNNGVNADHVNVSNTTLFQVAADHYADATLWTYIAQVNNLTDFYITSGITLTIPPKPNDNVRFGT